MAKWNFDPVTGQPITRQSGGGYRQNNNSYTQSGNNNSSFNNGGQTRKHSGCKAGLTRTTNKPYLRGWKYDKTNGLRAFIAGPNKKTHETKSSTGRLWHNWTVKVTGKAGIELYNCLYMPTDNKVVIKDLGIVMNPKTNYVGPFYRRKNKN